MALTDEGVVLPPAKDSLDAASDTANERVEAEGQDTRSAASHSPESETTEQPEPDIDELLAKLESVKDKIPGERLQFLNPNMQSGFNRKMNWLQQNVDRVQKAIEQQGIQLPPGKSAMDLLTEDDGKGFFDAIAQMNEKAVAPVKDYLSQQQQQQRVMEMGEAAKREYPIVRENYDEAIKLIVENPDLSKLAAADNFGALPLVLQGASTAIAYERATKENQSLKKLLEANKIALKTGGSTTRTGGAPLKDTATTAKTIDKAYEIAKTRLEQAG